MSRRHPEMAAITEVLFGEIAAAVEPLVDAATADGGSGDGIRELAREVGYDIDAAFTPALAQQVSTSLGSAWAAIDAIIADPNGFADRIPDLGIGIAGVISGLQGLDSLAGPAADLGR